MSIGKFGGGRKFVAQAFWAAIAAAAFATTGCGGADQNGFPEALDPNLRNQITLERPGASAVAARLVIDLGRANQAEIPHRDLFTAPTSRSQGRREKLLRRLSADGRALVEAVRLKCSILPFNTRAVGDAREGGKMTAVSTASTSGGACPVEHFVQSEAAVTIETLDRKASTFSARGQLTMSMRQSVADPAALARAGLRSIVFQASGPMRMLGASPTDPKAGSEHARFAGRGELTLSSGQTIEVDLSGEHLRRGDRLDRQALVVFKLPAGNVAMGFIEENGTKSAYLNGKKDGDGSLDEVFGID